MPEENRIKPIYLKYTNYGRRGEELQLRSNLVKEYFRCEIGFDLQAQLRTKERAQLFAENAVFSDEEWLDMLRLFVKMGYMSEGSFRDCAGFIYDVNRAVLAIIMYRIFNALIIDEAAEEYCDLFHEAQEYLHERGYRY